MTPQRFRPIMLLLVLTTLGCGATGDESLTDAQSDQTWQAYAESRRASRTADESPTDPSIPISDSLFPTDATIPLETDADLALSSGNTNAGPDAPVADAGMAVAPGDSTEINETSTTHEIAAELTETASTMQLAASNESAIVRLPPVNRSLDRLPAPDSEPEDVESVPATLIPAPFFASVSTPEHTDTEMASHGATTHTDNNLFELAPPQTSRSIDAGSAGVTKEFVAQRNVDPQAGATTGQTPFGFPANWSALVQEDVVESTNDKLADVPAEALRSLALSPEMTRRAEEMMTNATRLAERGALYSARTEFLRVMRLVAQSLDSDLGYRYHTRALSMGLQALDEADDFAARGTSVANDLQVAGYVAGHRTPVLKGKNIDEYTPLMAMQAYYAYAMRHLQLAGNNQQVASRALYGLGKIDMSMSHIAGQGSHGGPTPVALFQAALAVDQHNADAANELGVLMARCGQLEEATRYLEQSLAVRATPAAAGNLAEVRRRRGVGGPAGPSQGPNPVPSPVPNQEMIAASMAQRVQWVDPRAFMHGPDGVNPTLAQLPDATLSPPGSSQPMVNQPPATDGRANPMAGFGPPVARNSDRSATTAQGLGRWFSR